MFLPKELAWQLTPPRLPIEDGQPGHLPNLVLRSYCLFDVRTLTPLQLPATAVSQHSGLLIFLWISAASRVLSDPVAWCWVRYLHLATSRHGCVSTQWPSPPFPPRTISSLFVAHSGLEQELRHHRSASFLTQSPSGTCGSKRR
jgi:hypothetical protein